ncbi:ribokinase [Catellatospora sp. TT07R-123]|uniref:carbohydrate kinase family protein n=1 Tax=Catellatospora sp. TT07R-123 TaxID=2733863 RepID=UPI001AFE2A98|nr:PfkB family carbohydrate kinase [Catellatospora sp. TT07R-123]GHJ47528.1 ribokinase [Catellatospora sp. TT07R-123]
MTAGFTVVGGVNHDEILTLSGDPGPDGTTDILAVHQAPGGHAANTAVVLARLGHQPCLVGAVGSDQAGERLLAHLAAEGVDTGWMQVVPGAATGRAVIVNAPSLHHMMLHRAANDALTPSFPDSRVMVVFDPPPAVLPQAVAAGQTVVVNPGGRIAAAHRALADRRGGIVLVANRTEWAQLGDAAADGYAAVVVTLGAEGCRVHDADGWSAVPAVPAVEVDATGAGDAFTAGLAAGLGAGLPLRTAAGLGALLGALAVEAPGATGLPGGAELARAVSERADPAAAEFLLGGLQCS